MNGNRVLKMLWVKIALINDRWRAHMTASHDPPVNDGLSASSFDILPRCLPCTHIASY